MRISTIEKALPALVLIAAVALASCGKKESAPPAPAPAPVTQSEHRPRAVYIQGDPVLLRSGAVTPLEEGDWLLEGDHLTTDERSSVEIAYGSLATVRLLPSSSMTVREIPGDKVSSEIALSSGAVLAKVKKLSGGDEFLVSTPYSSAGVRGTAYLVRCDTSGVTRVAVQEGSVALLPRGTLLDNLISSRHESPVAQATVATAFANARAAGAGEEMVFDGKNQGQLDAAEAAYGTIVVAAETARSSGTDLDEVADPAALLSPGGSVVATSLHTAFSSLKSRSLSSGNRELLDLLGHLREPGSEYSVLPASLPLEQFVTGKKALPAPTSLEKSWPAVVWSSAVSQGGLTGSLTRTGDAVIALDDSGAVYAVSLEGVKLWSSGPKASEVTALDRSVVLVKGNSASILDATTGSEKGNWSYAGATSTVLSRAVPVPEGLALATPRGVALLRSENASLLKEILVPDGLSSPPVLAGKELVGVTGSGSLVIIDLTGGTVIQEFAGLVGKDSFAPRYRAGLVFASDRSGHLAAVDVAARKLLWQRALGSGLLGEPEVGADKLWLWGKDHSVRSLSAVDGSDGGSSLKGVESAPLLSRDRLYCGISGGILVVVDSATGKELKRISLPEAQAVRPIMIGGSLFVGTKGGKVIKVKLEE